jgi:hypothetical protein
MQQLVTPTMSPHADRLAGQLVSWLVQQQFRAASTISGHQSSATAVNSLFVLRSLRFDELSLDRRRSLVDHMPPSRLAAAAAAAQQWTNAVMLTTLRTTMPNPVCSDGPDSDDNCSAKSYMVMRSLRIVSFILCRPSNMSQQI